MSDLKLGIIKPEDIKLQRQRCPYCGNLVYKEEPHNYWGWHCDDCIKQLK